MVSEIDPQHPDRPIGIQMGGGFIKPTIKPIVPINTNRPSIGAAIDVSNPLNPSVSSGASIGIGVTHRPSESSNVGGYGYGPVNPGELPDISNSGSGGTNQIAF